MSKLSLSGDATETGGPQQALKLEEIKMRLIERGRSLSQNGSKLQKLAQR